MSENIVEGQLHLKGLFVVIEKFQDVKLSFFFFNFLSYLIFLILFICKFKNYV